VDYKWESNEEAKKEFDPIADKIVELHKALLTENGILKLKIKNLEEVIENLQFHLQEDK